ncbi:MAG: DUF4355 domain-containing protein [Lachnospiraceae bacterium]|nr:DUF4355 domain-containing protein [Lachnospiraceae bacterium]
MGEFKVIETQEQLDAVLGERLKRERETVKKEYAGYLSPEDVKKYEGYLSPEDVAKKYEGYLSPEDVTKKYAGYLSPEEAAKKDAKIKGYETDSVKTRVAHEVGLSYDAVAFLKGEDEETIRKSAETLKTLVGSSNVAPLASTENGVGKADEAAYKNVLKGLKGE